MTTAEAITILGPSAASDRRRLRARYRRLAFLHHPDRNRNSAASVSQFARVAQAYHLLDELLSRAGELPSCACARCRVRPAERRGLDRNPYCRDCLVYAGGRRMLPAPPTVVASCALTAAGLALALVLLIVFLATGASIYGMLTLCASGASLLLLATHAVMIARVSRRATRTRFLRTLLSTPPRRMARRRAAYQWFWGHDLPGTRNRPA